MIKRLVIGSKNKAKVAEWSQILGQYIPVISISELGEFPDVEETGETFEENAVIKAKYYASLTGDYVFAEDGGFEIDYLGGKPGVKSRRILPGDKEATDLQIVEYVLKELSQVKGDKRKARLKAAAVIVNPQGKVLFIDENSLEGTVPERVESITIEGYPYRDLLFIEEVNKIYSQFEDSEHKRYNHKVVIAKKIGAFLKNARY